MRCVLQMARGIPSVLCIDRLQVRNLLLKIYLRSFSHFKKYKEHQCNTTKMTKSNVVNCKYIIM